MFAPLSGVFHADFWPHVKYTDTEYRNYEQQYSSGFFWHFHVNGVRGFIRNFSDSDVDIWGENYPFFFKPNIVIKPRIIAARMPLRVRYGQKLLRQDNIIDCRVEVANIPPKGHSRFFKSKGKISARNVTATLLTNIVGQKEQVFRPLRWIGVSGAPTYLPELPNDGTPVPLHFLQIRLDDHEMMTVDVRGPKHVIHYLPPNTYHLWIKAGETQCYLGQYKLPEDLISIAAEPEDVAYAVSSGGYAVYLEKTEGGLLINWNGVMEYTQLAELVELYNPKQVLHNGKSIPIPKSYS